MPGGKVFGTIYHGANFDISPADVDHLMPLVQDAFALMLQLEIPPETVCYAIRRAHAAGTPVILNAAPACPLPEDVLGLCHTFMANEVEASFYTGTVIETPQQAMDAIRPFCARHGIRAIFTLGAQGAAACDGGQARLIPPGSGHRPWKAPARVTPLPGALSRRFMPEGISFRQRPSPRPAGP